MASKNPTPDAHGRYRVRTKGDKNSPSWSTREFNPELHVIVGGDASDSYGNALPASPHWPAQTPADVTPTDLSESTTTTDEEPSNEH